MTHKGLANKGPWMPREACKGKAHKGPWGDPKGPWGIHNGPRGPQGTILEALGGRGVRATFIKTIEGTTHLLLSYNHHM